MWVYYSSNTFVYTENNIYSFLYINNYEQHMLYNYKKPIIPWIHKMEKSLLYIKNLIVILNA